MNDPNVTGAEVPAGRTRRSPLFVTLALFLAGLIAGGAVGGAGAAYLVRGGSLPALVAPAAGARAAAAEAGVMAVIRRANEAQQQAFARNDATLMRDSATDAYYAQLASTQRQLKAGGVREINLVDLRFDGVTVEGESATATTYETWRTTYADGSSEESTDRNDYTLVLRSGAWKIDADVQPGAARSTGPAPEQIAPAAAARDASVSSNWSGYTATNGTFTSVSGTWVVPTPSTSTNGVDATWVGIGGVTGRDLIQAGTQAIVDGGTVEYEAWIEMLPASSQPVSLSVRGGDTVSVAIAEQSSGTWSIAIRNETTSRSYSATVRYASSRGSAEWIEEAPSSGRRLIPLSDFGTVRFTAASTVKDGLKLSAGAAGAKPVTMIDGARRALAEPSVLGTDGASFTVTRTQIRQSAPSGRRPRG